MKTIFFICVSIFASSLAIASGTTHKVSMKSISFDPKVLNIKAGDSVEWTNVSYTDHSATSDDVSVKDDKATAAGTKGPTSSSEEDANGASRFDTGLIGRKKSSKKIEFKKPGTYMYHCSIHGHSMSGKIEVAP